MSWQAVFSNLLRKAITFNAHFANLFNISEWNCQCFAFLFFKSAFFSDICKKRRKGHSFAKILKKDKDEFLVK